MYPDKPLTPLQRHFLAVFLGALPALFLGFYIGCHTAGIGSPRDISATFIRGGVCSVPAVALALVIPRCWLLPSLIYGFGFCVGYTIPESIAASMTPFIALPIAAITGIPVGHPAQATHPELLWILLIAFWLASFSYFLRIHFQRSDRGT